MTITLHITPDLEQRLDHEPERRGVPPNVVALQALEEHLSPKAHPEETLALLESWLETGDSQEDQETGAELIRALDEDRLSNRKLFPPETKGAAW